MCSKVYIFVVFIVSFNCTEFFLYLDYPIAGDFRRVLKTDSIDLLLSTFDV
jgi:hypothetical protein